MNLLSFTQAFAVLQFTIQSCHLTSIKVFECPLPKEMLCKISDFFQFEDSIANYTVYIQPVIIQSCSTNESLIPLKRDGFEYYLDQSINTYTFNICLKYKEDPLEHVGIITYLGFISPVSVPLLAQGDRWLLDYLVSLPLGSNPGQSPMYSVVALKVGGNCEGSVIGQGKLVQKQYSQELPILSFNSGNHLITYAPVASFCSCPFVGECKLMSHYTNFLTKASIKGPHSISIITDCVYGRRCQIQVAGNYEIITGVFSAAYQCKGDIPITNDQKPGVFVFPDSAYISGQATNQLQLCWQVKTPHNGVPISIGTIYAHYLYAGNIIVVPFGEQILLNSRFNICTDGTLLLFEKLPGNSDWKLVSKLVDDDALSIDYNFSSDCQYELRYCNNCDEHINCIDESRDSNALIHSVIMRGVSNYTNFTCILGAICKIMLPIINQATGAKDGTNNFGNILVSQECGSILRQMKFINNYGLLSASRVSVSEGSLVAEYLVSSKKVPNHAASHLLHICYCNRELTACRLSDYTIQVGTLFFRDATMQECWTGNSCVFSAAGSLAQERISLRHACHIPNSEVGFVGREKYARFIEAYTVNGQTRSRFEAKLSGDLMNSSVLKICGVESGTVFGEISIKSLSLVPNRIFVDSYQRVTFKTTELVIGRQVLLITNGGRNKSMLEFNDSNFTMSLDMSSGVYSLFWCYAGSFSSCNREGDFRLKIATIYISGLSPTQRRIKCRSGVDCVASMSVVKYFTKVNTFIVDQINSFGIVASVDDCTKGPPESKFIFHPTGKKDLKINEQNNDILYLSYTMEFVGKFPSNVIPNNYKVCISRPPDYSLVSGIYITLQGVVYSRSPILIDSGRSFNLSIRGYKTPNTIFGFFSDKSYGCSRIPDSQLKINMSPKPALSYPALGLVHYIWSEVSIKFVMNKFEGRLYLCLCWQNDCKNDAGYAQSGVEVVIAGPKYDANPRRMIASEEVELSLDTGYPVVMSAVLLKSSKSIGFQKIQYYTGYARHEVENLLHLRLNERKRMFPPGYNAGLGGNLSLPASAAAKYRLKATQVFGNGTLYYCSGYQCNSLEDFDTPLFQVLVEGPKFKRYMASMDALSIVNVSSTSASSYFDKFQIVYDDFDCNRALFHNGTIVSNTMNYLQARDYRHIFQLTLRNEFRYTPLGVNSLGLAIYTSNSTTRSFKICYCLFRAKLRCNMASDFSTNAGLITPLYGLDSHKASVHGGKHLCEKDPESKYTITGVIGGSNMMPGVPMGNFYLTEDELEQFMVSYFSSIHKGYALKYRVEIADAAHTGGGKKLNINRTGIYPNQQMFLIAESPNLLIIHGHGLNQTDNVSLMIVSSSQSCKNQIDSATAHTHFSSYRKTPTRIEYHDVVLPKIGYYRVCLLSAVEKGRGEGWLEVGIAEVKNFYRVPLNENANGPGEKDALSRGKREFSCMGHKGIYTYDGSGLYYRMILKNKLSPLPIDLQLPVSPNLRLCCTVARLSENPPGGGLGENQTELLLILDEHSITLAMVSNGILVKQPNEYIHRVSSPLHIQALDDLVLISSSEGLFLGDISRPEPMQHISMAFISSFSIIPKPGTRGGTGKAEYYLYVIEAGILYNYLMKDGQLTPVGKYINLSLPLSVLSILVSGTALTFVGERSTGRVIALEGVEGDLRLYKEIDSVGIVTGVDILGGFLAITSTQQTQYGLEKFTILRQLGSLTRIEFDYPIPQTLQSGQRYLFKPIIGGDAIDFITEDTSGGGSTYGLEIDPKTFALGGVLMAAGTNTLYLVGGNLFGRVYRSFTFIATCSSGFGWSERLGVCVECPIGSYRGSEPISACIQCETVKGNSTTLYIGSTSPLDCVCDPGYYQTGGNGGSAPTCSECEEGKFKDAAGDAACIQTCPKNMSSTRSGAKTLSDLACQCVPGFYLRASAKYGDICQTCEVGFYCEGGSAGPVRCPPNMTTVSQGAPSAVYCLCSLGYEVATGPTGRQIGCTECRKSHYKSQVGNVRCNLCLKDGMVSDAVEMQMRWYNMLLFSERVGSVDAKECRFCVSGYYYESKRCSVCPITSYCPGLASGPTFCGQNSSARDFRATDSIHCRCHKSFSYLARSPLDNSIVCKSCPSNWNYSTDFPRVPLFAEVSRSVGVAWYNSPGYHLPGAGGLWRAGPDGPRELSCVVSPGYTALEAQGRQFWGWYETSIYRESPALCAKSCEEFQFCRGFFFSGDDAKYASVVHTSEGATKIYHYRCRLFMYAFVGPEGGGEGVRKGWLGGGLEAVPEYIGLPVACEVSWSRGSEVMLPVPCPARHYCPGASAPLPCPANSTTLPPYYSKSISDCLCLRGFQGVRDREQMECVPCPQGYYKGAVGNELCDKCPDLLTTFQTGSPGPHACACLPGYYATASGAAASRVFRCAECLDGSYCEGGFSSPFAALGDVGDVGGVSDQLLPSHSTAKNCPSGSEILPSVHMATSAKQCVCLRGYELLPSLLPSPRCEKCFPGSYKEYHDNSSCAGRCPQSAMSFFGAMAKSQCFCQYGLYMRLGSGSDYGTFTGECTKCPVGALCPGGLSGWFVDKLSRDGSFTEIPFSAHVRPIALPGFWTHFADDGTRSFHPCSNIKACIGGLDRCERGSEGYLCDACSRGYFKQSFGTGCSRWPGWRRQIVHAMLVTVLKGTAAVAISRYSKGGVLRILYYSTLALVFNCKNLDSPVVRLLWTCASHSFSWPTAQPLPASPLTALIIPAAECLLTYPFPRMRGVMMLINLPGAALALGQMVPCAPSPLHRASVHVHRPSLPCSLRTQLLHALAFAALLIAYHFSTRGPGFFTEGARRASWHALATARLVALLLASLVRLTIHPFPRLGLAGLRVHPGTAYFAIELLWTLLYFYLMPYAPTDPLAGSAAGDCDAMERAGILGNIATASVLQASMYYDIKYIDHLPAAALALKVAALLRRVFAPSSCLTLSVSAPAGHDIICIAGRHSLARSPTPAPDGLVYADHIHFAAAEPRQGQGECQGECQVECQGEWQGKLTRGDERYVACAEEDVDGRLTIRRLQLDVSGVADEDELIVEIIRLLKLTEGTRSMRWSDDVLDFSLK